MGLTPFARNGENFVSSQPSKPKLHYRVGHQTCFSFSTLEHIWQPLKISIKLAKTHLWWTFEELGQRRKQRVLFPRDRGDALLGWRHCCLCFHRRPEHISSVFFHQEFLYLILLKWRKSLTQPGGKGRGLNFSSHDLPLKMKSSYQGEYRFS